jgi:hypothetical protein
VIIGRERSRDSAIVQLVLAREKASVAAAKSEISLVLGGDGESKGEVWDEVDAEVVFADSVGGGVEGGVGYADSESESGFDLSKTDMRFSSPRMLGIR